MKTKAAVGYAAGKPLEVQTVDLEGPRAGEVLVEIKATGICHTDEFTRSGADPEGLFPGDLRPRRRRHCRGRGARRDFSEEGGPRHSALHTGMPAVQVLPLAQDQSLHRHSRDAGQGRDAGRHQPLLDRRREDSSLHGLLDVLEFHGAARDRGREDSRGRAVRESLLHRLRRDDGHRRGHQHGESRTRRERRGVWPRRHRS